MLLAEAHRTLRPGGRLLLTVPFAARWHFVPNNYWRFTPSSLRHLLEAAGFGDVAVYARGNAFTVACYKAVALVLPHLFPQRGGAKARAAQVLAVSQCRSSSAAPSPAGCPCSGREARTASDTR